MRALQPAALRAPVSLRRAQCARAAPLRCSVPPARLASRRAFAPAAPAALPALRARLAPRRRVAPAANAAAPLAAGAAASRALRLVVLGGAGASSLSAAAAAALRGNPLFEAALAFARAPGLSPPALLAARLLGVWAASALALALINWASHAPQLAAAEAQLEAEAERVEEELEETLRRAGVHLPPLSGRLIHDHLAHPFRSFVLGTAVAAAAASIAAAASPSVAAAVLPPLLRGWQVFGVACVTWLAVFQEQLVFSGLARAAPADAGMLGVLSQLAQRATLGAGALAALHVLGVPLAALLTFGGVSGLAIGLAAQVAAANLVAGASLLVAQPFRVGDKVEVLGRGLIGFVTRFALDNTQLQLEDTTIVTLPNAELARAAVRNLSRMGHWRVAATLRVPLARAAHVRDLAQRLEAYCRSRPDFSEEPPRVVARVVLGDVAADHLPINVTTFMRAPGVTLPEFERRRHDILLALTDILEQQRMPLQLPASTVAVTGANAVGAAADAGGSAVPMV